MSIVRKKIQRIIQIKMKMIICHHFHYLSLSYLVLQYIFFTDYYPGYNHLLTSHCLAQSNKYLLLSWTKLIFYNNNLLDYLTPPRFKSNSHLKQRYLNRLSKLGHNELAQYLEGCLLRRCPWCNGYRRRKWTRRHEFKSWTILIAFHIALIHLGKVWIQLFSLQLWVNSRTDWVLQLWWGN